jgi:hypothetical protein
MRLFFRSPDEGSRTSVVAAASPKVRNKAELYKGAYLEPVGQLATPSKVAQDAELGRELWTTTETFLTSIGLD